MPNQRQKSVRTVIAEVVMFAGMVAVVGHMAINFWERFMIQSQLTQMKTSLYSLKDAVHDIEMAYDSLSAELQSVTPAQEKETFTYKNVMKTNKPSKCSPFPSHQTSNYQKKIEVQTMTQPKKIQAQAITQPKKIQVRTMMQPKKHYDVGTAFQKHVRDFIQEYRMDARNATTTTLNGYLPKSSGVNAVSSSADVPPSYASRKQFCCSCLHRCFDNEDAEDLIQYWD